MKQTYPSDLSQYATAADVIKHAIERSRYRSASAVNCETLSLYFGVGKFVSENSRTGFWGTKALASISVLLQRELPGLRGFSESALKRMRSFNLLGFLSHGTTLLKLASRITLRLSLAQKM